MVKEKTKQVFILNKFKYPLIIISVVFLVIILSCLFTYFFFETKYKDLAYPGVKIDGINFQGKSEKEIYDYFESKNKPLSEFNIYFTALDYSATVSASELNIAYDSKLVSKQALSIGRSGKLLSDLYQKIRSAYKGAPLNSIISFNEDAIGESLNQLSEIVNIKPEDALFQFENGKVTAFKLAKAGRNLNISKARNSAKKLIKDIVYKNKSATEYIISVDIDTINPHIKTEDSNEFGIKEMIGKGSSNFRGSIPGRIHNVALAASKINGHLVAPGETFSFNDTVGDISAQTGFQPAYVIKEGRTVLGDGGGVCQVSTTIFRAALNSGLPIIERHAHAYRVSYYEQDSAPGLDATVFAPSVDLKFQNDTGNYILIQATTDKSNYSLVFEFFGKNDGRRAEITKPVILSQSPPPPAQYQDDPTLPKGVVKQVDWSAPGAKVKFDYKVVRENETLIEKTFFTSYTPWRAIYLNGTKEG